MLPKIATMDRAEIMVTPGCYRGPGYRADCFPYLLFHREFSALPMQQQCSFSARTVQFQCSQGIDAAAGHRSEPKRGPQKHGLRPLPEPELPHRPGPAERPANLVRKEVRGNGSHLRRLSSGLLVG
jgi:hypothetical protein